MLHRISHLGFVNAYLVEEPDGLTLIDTTLAGGARRILREAQRVGRPIRRIALTHAHADHVGGLDRVARAVGDVEVLISARDARLLAGDRSPVPGEPQSKVRGGFKAVRTPVTGTLTPGERVGSLEVVAAPGHTPGHVALLDTRDRTLFCGDAYATAGGVATSAKGHWRFPFPAMATWDRATALETAERLRALEPARLAPGHGKVLDEPVAAMQAAIERVA